MKELDPAVFVAVFQEMLGWLFWPLVAFVVLGAVALVTVIVRERGLDTRRLVLSEVIGVLGGFFGIWLTLTITNSRLSDAGGPIDWLLMAATWLAGAIGAAITAYVLLAVLRSARGARTVRAAPGRAANADAPPLAVETGRSVAG